MNDRKYDIDNIEETYRRMIENTNHALLYYNYYYLWGSFVIANSLLGVQRRLYIYIYTASARHDLALKKIRTFPRIGVALRNIK